VPWPSEVSFTVPAEIELLPSPAAEDFIYHSARATSSFAASPRKRAGPSLLAAKGGPKAGASRVSGLPRGPASARTRPIGHQLTISKPTADLKPASGAPASSPPAACLAHAHRRCAMASWRGEHWVLTLARGRHGS
jgi:hypothetical protein